MEEQGRKGEKRGLCRIYKSDSTYVASSGCGPKSLLVASIAIVSWCAQHKPYMCCFAAAVPDTWADQRSGHTARAKSPARQNTLTVFMMTAPMMRDGLSLWLPGRVVASLGLPGGVPTAGTTGCCSGG
jgi:hypothetical protein